MYELYVHRTCTRLFKFFFLFYYFDCAVWISDLQNLVGNILLCKMVIIFNWSICYICIVLNYSIKSLSYPCEIVVYDLIRDLLAWKHGFLMIYKLEIGRKTCNFSTILNCTMISFSKRIVNLSFLMLVRSFSCCFVPKNCSLKVKNSNFLIK